GEAGRRVVETVAEGLWARAQHHEVGRAPAHGVLPRPFKRGALLLGESRRRGRAGGERRSHLGRYRRGQVEMNAEQSWWRRPRQLGGDDGTPVAALGDVARVAEASHQLGPDLRDVLRTPAGGGWSTGKAVAGNRRNHDIEGVRGGAAVRDRIREWTDGPEELEHRARPPVRDEQWHGVLFL